MPLSEQDQILKSNSDIAEILFPNNELTVEDVEQRYPDRDLPLDAKVTRIAPSPTGFMHIGGLYTVLISERIAHQSGGIFLLRIEDTDKKREVDGATQLIVRSLNEYGIRVDEGEIADSVEVGEYGPYRQSQRGQIYKAYVKKLVREGNAYPCFCTQEELEGIREEQAEQKVRPGYYGDWAQWRQRDPEEVIARIKAGDPYVIRLKSPGHYEERIVMNDMLKGEVSMPENDQDVVILKSDGLPTYHFAHVVDDHLMGTTDVIRGDEWLSSLPLHYQLFSILGWEALNYGHLAPIEKIDGGSRRKLSKRKDPEASVEYYSQLGFPREAVLGYLFNLANSGYEVWRAENPNADPLAYELSFAQLQKGSGALIDFAKMADMSKEVVFNLGASEVYARTLAWAERYYPDFAQLLHQNRDYALSILDIERDTPNPRKDIVKWEDFPRDMGYFFDEIFYQAPLDLSQLSELDPAEVGRIGDAVAEIYDIWGSNDEWMQNMRSLAGELGYAPDNKTYKADPDRYKGQFGLFAKVVRVLLSGKNQTPNLYEVMKVMGKERVIRRLTQS